MNPKPASVFVVDDDDAVRNSLRLLLKSVGLPTVAFASAREYLDSWHPAQPGCLVLDVRMPGMSGLDLQRELARRGSPLPVVLVTGHGDIPMAVAALKAGAQDFLEKPVDDEALVAAIHRALATSVRRQEAASAVAALRGRHARLTAREAQVMALVVAGHSNVSIAGQLGLSQRTVEHYRAQVMIKMEAASLAALVQAAAALGEAG